MLTKQEMIRILQLEGDIYHNPEYEDYDVSFKYADCTSEDSEY